MSVQFFALSQGTNQNERGQFSALPGGIVLHGILNLVICQREIRAFAQLILVNVIGIHQHDRNTGFLLEGVTQFHRIVIVDQSKILVAVKGGTEVETVNSGHTLAADFIKQSMHAERSGDRRYEGGENHARCCMPTPVELMPAKGARSFAQKPGCTCSLVRTLPVHIAITFAVKERTSPGWASGST